MKRRIILCVPAFLAIVLAASTAAAGITQVFSIQNSELRVDVGRPGGWIAIGATGGDPKVSGDENKALLSGFLPNGKSAFGASKTYVTKYGVDVDVLEESAYDSTWQQEQIIGGRSVNTIVSKYNYGGFEILKVVMLTADPDETTFKCAAVIKYLVSNMGTETNKISLAAVLDVQLAQQNTVQVYVPEYGSFSQEAMFCKPGTMSSQKALPRYWRAFESPMFGNGSLWAYGIISRYANAVMPDFFMVVDKAKFEAEANPFDYYYKFTYPKPPDLTVNNTAVVHQWNDITLGQYGEALCLVEYGMPGKGMKKGWVDVVRKLDEPARQRFLFYLWLMNPSGVDWYGGSTNITLSPGMNILNSPARDAGSGKAAYQIGTIEGGSGVCVAWEAECDSSDDAPASYHCLTETSFFNADTLLTMDAINANPPQASGNNYLNLDVSPDAMASGAGGKLFWNADPAGWDFRGVPVDVYLALKMDPSAIDRPSKVSDALGDGGQLYIFNPGMKSMYPYEGRLGAPTFGNVVLPAGASGYMNFRLSGSSAVYNFAVAFIRRDNNRFVRADYPVENSPPFWLY